MAIFKFQLKTIKSRTELAERLSVNIQALDVVSLSESTTCGSDDCCLPAALNNDNKCILCQQTWFPRELDENNSERGDNDACRGYGLYGPQFMREYNGQTAKSACCCTSPLCLKIGYSHVGMMDLPHNKNQCIAATTLLGIIDPARCQEIINNPQNYQVAPWHYSPHHHRMWNQKYGRWEFRMIKGSRSTNFSPPNYSVQKFIDEEIPLVRNKGSGCGNANANESENDSLPAWVDQMVRIQEVHIALASGSIRLCNTVSVGTTNNNSKLPAAEEMKKTLDLSEEKKRADSISEEEAEEPWAEIVDLGEQKKSASAKGCEGGHQQGQNPPSYAASLAYRELQKQKQDNIMNKVPQSQSPSFAKMTRKRNVSDAFNDDEDGLPELKKNNKCLTPFGRVRTCMCQNRLFCRDLMWRWARLGEGKYINYMSLPKPANSPDAPWGKHINAYRKAALLHLGYDANNNDEKLGIIAIWHFHPDIRPYILQLKDHTGSKVDRYRISFELGQRLGMKEEDECPTPDTNGESSFFAVPNYGIEKAEADIEKAEMEYKEKYKQMKQAREELLSDPAKLASENIGLQAIVDNLTKENNEMKERLKQEKSTQKATEKKYSQLLKDFERMARKLNLFEKNDVAGPAPKLSAKSIYKQATGKDLKNGCFGSKTDQGRAASNDPRMDCAVKAIWENPSLSPEEALLVGGFEFPSLDSHQKCGSEKYILDQDGTSLRDRKKVLRRRVKSLQDRLAKKAISDTEAANDFEALFSSMKPPPPYGGLDLSNVPEQPLVRSAQSKTGFSGVLKSTSGRYIARIGDGMGGKKRDLGVYDTAEEAAGIYARAKYYLEPPKYPPMQAGLPYGGLDLSNIPEQPLVRSARSKTGFKGVLLSKSGRYMARIGNGTNGGTKRELGLYDTAEEAAGIYARAKRYLELEGMRRRGTKGGFDNSNGEIGLEDDELNCV